MVKLNKHLTDDTFHFAKSFCSSVVNVVDGVDVIICCN